MNIERLKKLSETSGISGHEKDISTFLEQELSHLGFSYHTDSFGNLHGHRPGTGKHILLEAHMDQVGMMISEITEDGFLRFSPVGGLDLRVLPSQNVLVRGKKPILGVVCCHPSAAPDDKSKVPTLDKLCIDTGLGEAAKEFVSVGDLVSFTGEAFLQNGFFFGRALDNRACIEAVLSLLEITDVNAEISVLFAVQEEVGLVGATVGTYSKSADLAVVLDVTFGLTHAEREADSFVCGKGPTIGLGPSVSRRDAKNLIHLATVKNIPHQIEVMGGSSGTDAWAIQLSGEGVPTVLVSIPLRYMHTPVEAFSICDFENTVTLLDAYLKEVCRSC